jgi:hypothetical protein
MPQNQTFRTFSTAFKLDVIARLEAGASKVALADGLWGYCERRFTSGMTAGRFLVRKG